jgi:hypothetical protein
MVTMMLSTAGDWHAVQLLSLTATDFAAIAPLVSDLESDGLQLSGMPRPTINFNQPPSQTMIVPSGDLDVWVTASANVLLAPKATP